MAASAMAELRPLYKRLLALAKTLPDAAKREATLQQVRTEFRSLKDPTDAKEVAALVQRAQSKIGYLKIVTPRAKADAGVQSYVYQNGKRVSSESIATEEGARYKTVDMESNLRRHNHLLRRQHFGRMPTGPSDPF